MTARTRRLVGATGVAIVIVALIIAILSVLGGPDISADLRPPMLVPGPILSVIFLSAPGVIATIGAIRRSNVIVVIAGISALLQSPSRSAP